MKKKNYYHLQKWRLNHTIPESFCRNCNKSVLFVDDSNDNHNNDNSDGNNDYGKIIVRTYCGDTKGIDDVDDYYYAFDNDRDDYSD